MVTYWYISALIVGLGSSIHCLGMCGPLVMAMPWGRNKIVKPMIYLISKALGYGVIGYAFSGLGTGASFFIGQNVLSLVAALFILLVLFYTKLFRLPVFRRYSYFISSIIQNLKPTRWIHFSLLGFVNAFIPCTMVLAAASMAVVIGNPIDGFIFMFYYGVGTIPVLFFIAAIPSFIPVSIRPRLQQMSVFIGVLAALLLIGRSMHIPSSIDSSNNSITICK